jgi:hypothetical protein
MVSPAPRATIEGETAATEVKLGAAAVAVADAGSEVFVASGVGVRVGMRVGVGGMGVGMLVGGVGVWVGARVGVLVGWAAAPTDSDPAEPFHA